MSPNEPDEIAAVGGCIRGPRGPTDSATFAKADASLSSSSSMTNTVGGAPAGVIRVARLPGRVKLKTCTARSVVGGPQAAAM
jgi:hypothetical protein